MHLKLTVNLTIHSDTIILEFSGSWSCIYLCNALHLFYGNERLRLQGIKLKEKEIAVESEFAI